MSLAGMRASITARCAPSSTRVFHFDAARPSRTSPARVAPGSTRNVEKMSARSEETRSRRIFLRTFRRARETFFDAVFFVEARASSTFAGFDRIDVQTRAEHFEADVEGALGDHAKRAVVVNEVASPR